MEHVKAGNKQPGTPTAWDVWDRAAQVSFPHQGCIGSSARSKTPINSCRTRHKTSPEVILGINCPVRLTKHLPPSWREIHLSPTPPRLLQEQLQDTQQLCSSRSWSNKEEWRGHPGHHQPHPTPAHSRGSVSLAKLSQGKSSLSFPPQKPQGQQK